MVRSKYSWEEVSQFNRIRQNGTLWQKDGQYFYVQEEGTVFSELVVYDMSKKLFDMLVNGIKSEDDIRHMLMYGTWPMTVAGCHRPTMLIAYPELQKNYSNEQLAEILPVGEKQWLNWRTPGLSQVLLRSSILFIMAINTCWNR